MSSDGPHASPPTSQSTAGISPSIAPDQTGAGDVDVEAPQPELTPGVTLGTYRIQEKLGEGGMGVVFMALDTGLDRTVALKVLLPGGHDDAKRAQRFVREARAMARLSHPNLLHVYNVGSDKGCHYFAMEMLRGETLFQAIHRLGSIPVQDMLHCLVQIVSALFYVHKAGITHRDIKSGNIMLCGRRAVLMDFGLAKDESDSGLTSIGAVLGTPDYMSPEAAEGLSAGPPTDIYSLGVVLYEALSGRLPFVGKSAISIIRQHMDSLPPALETIAPDVRPELAAIVARCMAKKPEDRFPDCPALARALWDIVPEQALIDVAEGRIPGADAMPLEQLHLSGSAVAQSYAAAASSVPGGATLTGPRLSTPAGSGSAGEPLESSPAQDDVRTVADFAPAQPARRTWLWGAGAAAALLFVALAVYGVVHGKKKPLAGQPIVRKTAHTSDREILREFRAGDPDPAQWYFIVSQRQSDGTWKDARISYRDYVTGKSDTELIFTDDTQSKP